MNIFNLITDIRVLTFLMAMMYMPQAFLYSQDQGRFALNTYVDAYYGAFTDDLPLNDFQQFTTVSARDNQLGINAVQLGLSYTQERVRAAITLHYGDIAKATWSEDFQMIQEGYAGVSLAKGLWLDAGFFTTHVGTESFLPKNNLLSSTAVATYIGPFYQGGARISWEGGERFEGAFYVINGYNQFLDRNRAKSYGVYLRYTLSNDLVLTYTNMLGRESEEDAPRDQYLVYQNVYATWENGLWQLVAGGDVAFQSNSALADPQEGATMVNFLATVRYQLKDHFSATARFEVYDDPDGFLSGTFPEGGGERGLSLTGYTAGLEYRPFVTSFLRAELRYLQSGGLNIFTDGGVPQNDRWEFMLTLGMYLDDLALFP